MTGAFCSILIKKLLTKKRQNKKCPEVVQEHHRIILPWNENCMEINPFCFCFVVCLIVLLPAIFGTEAVWIAHSAAEAFAALLCVALIRRGRGEWEIVLLCLHQI